MKTSKILELTVNEFEGLLNETNWEWAKERYGNIAEALEKYQEGARASDQDDYLEVNEYFDEIRENEELYGND